jgi:4-amino-4-deoxy-L-arabinose transferase-like glycosyltransferase
LALWTKGLIGPVLVAAGLAVYSIVEFKARPWRRLRVGLGILVLLAATGALAYLIYAESGWEMLREWFWVNHVARFVAPEGTGHEAPFYYYLRALPLAVLPWWIAAAECFRPSVWRREAQNAAVRRYWGLMTVGMVLMLSASVTKRELYLLPALPPLFLLFAAHAVSVWTGISAHLKTSVRWWLQLALCAGFSLGPVAVVAVYIGSADALVVWFLAATAALVVVTALYAAFGPARRALVALVALTVAGAVGLLEVVPHQAGFMKDMGPFMTWVDEQLPEGEPVYAVGHYDETLEGIVPFTTGRKLIRLTLDELARTDHPYVLVQDTDNRGQLANPPESYEPVRVEVIGNERYLGLWKKTD